MDEIDKIIDNLKTLKEHHRFDLVSEKEASYKEGFNNGFKQSRDIERSNCDVKNIDWESIKIFAGWCYINGIDFSYMAKGTDTIPFTERVVKRFEQDMLKEK